jgi:hypothetical protein
VPLRLHLNDQAVLELDEDMYDLNAAQATINLALETKSPVHMLLKNGRTVKLEPSELNHILLQQV